MARAAAGASGVDSAAQAVDGLVRELRGYARDLLGITELDDRVAQLMPAASPHPRLPPLCPPAPNRTSR